jgi:hypothetical protein
MNQVRSLNQAHEGKVERPIAITVICILGFVGAALSIPMVFSDIARQIGNWFTPYSASVAAISLICMIGLWFTKKWAIYAYICLVVLNQIVLITMDKWELLILIIQGIIVAVILLHLDSKVKYISYQLVRYVRRQIWGIIVAYMLGIHNSYKEVQKTPDDVVIVIEDVEAQEDSTPKN